MLELPDFCDLQDHVNPIFRLKMVLKRAGDESELLREVSELEAEFL